MGPHAHILACRGRLIEAKIALASLGHGRRSPKGGLTDWFGPRRLPWRQWQYLVYSARRAVATRAADLDHAIAEAARLEAWRTRELAAGFDIEQDRRDEQMECWPC